MPEFIKHYEMPKSSDISLDGIRIASELKFEAQMVSLNQLVDEMIIKAIINEAKLRGVTDLYLVDSNFVVEAIKEKIERELKK